MRSEYDIGIESGSEGDDERRFILCSMMDPILSLLKFRLCEQLYSAHPFVKKSPCTVAYMSPKTLP